MLNLVKRKFISKPNVFVIGKARRRVLYQDPRRKNNSTGAAESLRIAAIAARTVYLTCLYSVLNNSRFYRDLQDLFGLNLNGGFYGPLLAKRQVTNDNKESRPKTFKTTDRAL